MVASILIMLYITIHENALLFARNIIHFIGSINSLDDLNEKSALSLKQAWLDKKSKLFSEWSHSGKISLIITGKDPFTNRKNEIFNLSNLMTKQNFHPNQFLQAIGMQYFSHLKSSKTLQVFYRPVSVASLKSLTFGFTENSNQKKNNSQLTMFGNLNLLG